jgi:hypothetical protein
MEELKDFIRGSYNELYEYQTVQLPEKRLT